MRRNKLDICVPVTIPVMHCFDNNYVIPAAVSFYSMLLNADHSYYYKLYVLHSDITIQNQMKLSQLVYSFSNASLEFIDMGDYFNELWMELSFSGHYSKEVLYKLLAASIFPQYEKIIITDVDVVFMGDVSKSFFSFEIDEEIFFAGVHQIMLNGTWIVEYYKNYEEHFGRDSFKKIKICGGYIVANLYQLRKKNMEGVFIAFLKKNAYRLLQSEQDVINFCCDDSTIKYLPLNYVVCSYQYDMYENADEMYTDSFYTKEQLLDAMRNPIQIHYATNKKPWKYPELAKADVWFGFLAKSNFFYDYIKKERALLIEDIDYISNREISGNEKENSSPLIVSVLCCTYNHEEFIRDTIESLVSQKTDFPYEIIIVDDASTDSTPKIITEYHNKYPDLIRSILREKNLGIGPSYYDALCTVRGKYLAICDGDDCWIDRLKLKKQVDFLNENTDYNICCSSCIKHNVSTGEDVLYNPNEYIESAITIKEFYSFKDLLNCRFIASSTVMFRWQLRDNVPEFLKFYHVIDFPLVLLHAAGGKVKVMENELFAKYNIHDHGITSTNNKKVETETFCIINEVNQFLNYRFQKIVDNYMNSYKVYIECQRKAEEEKEFAFIENQRIKVYEESKAVEINYTEKEEEIHKCFTIIEIMCLLYIECVPEILKRLWRIIKKICFIIYWEFTPNIIKRGYREIKRRVKGKLK